jgi:hypothetical protein
MNESFLFSPVAEYRGVAILERRGDKRAAWMGKEYQTDGWCYVFARSGTKDILTLGLPCEREAKEVIDALIAGPVEGMPPVEDLLSYHQVLKVLDVPSEHLEAYRRAELRWRWDDIQGVFVQV